MKLTEGASRLLCRIKQKYVLTGDAAAYEMFRTYSPDGEGEAAAMKGPFRPAVDEQLRGLTREAG
jgi:hypothetical protein